MAQLAGIGILVLRVALGVIFFAHGAQKLFGWFGGRGLSGAAGLLASVGVRPARLFALINALGEFLGGLGVAFGFLTPLAAAAILGSMIVAILKVHLRRGFFNQGGGFEFPLVLAVMAFAIGLVGAGPYSLDAVLGIRLPEPWTYVIALAAMSALDLYIVTRPSPAPPQA
jgi:putative oxidoreductase